VAGIKRLSQFFLQSVFQGMAWVLCGNLDEGILERTDDCDVEGGILTPHPMLNVHVRGVTIISWDDVPLLG
jgi:hypothetical protein